MHAAKRRWRKSRNKKTKSQSTPSPLRALELRDRRALCLGVTVGHQLAMLSRRRRTNSSRRRERAPEATMTLRQTSASKNRSLLRWLLHRHKPARSSSSSSAARQPTTARVPRADPADPETPSRPSTRSCRAAAVLGEEEGKPREEVAAARCPRRAAPPPPPPALLLLVRSSSSSSSLQPHFRSPRSLRRQRSKSWPLPSSRELLFSSSNKGALLPRPLLLLFLTRPSKRPRPPLRTRRRSRSP